MADKYRRARGTAGVDVSESRRRESVLSKKTVFLLENDEFLSLVMVDRCIET